MFTPSLVDLANWISTCPPERSRPLSFGNDGVQVGRIFRPDDAHGRALGWVVSGTVPGSLGNGTHQRLGRDAGEVLGIGGRFTGGFGRVRRGEVSMQSGILRVKGGHFPGAKSERRAESG
jgi:hypothetical protein